MFLASAAHARGLLTGNGAARAVSFLEADQRRLALASALEDLAVAEIWDGRREQAVAALDRALAIYAGCGARWDLAGSAAPAAASASSAACPQNALPWGGRP